MKLGFICPQAPGHLNPLTALARQLLGRNHDLVFLYSSDAASLPFGADLMLAVNGKERSLAEYNVLFDQVGLRTIKTTPLDNGYVVIETAAI
jgi:UDP:flavonoid glycosyltransferase YjiC (YdhE family)